MVTTTQRMLAELRRPELFEAVLEEVGRVRAEMGYPIIVTPVSQLIATQATRNVIDSERWSTVSDETVRYFLGHYGESPAPVDPEIADRVLARPQAAKLAGLEPISLDGARERFGTRISDEELLLRLTMPEEQVDAMVAARSDAPTPAPGKPARAGDGHRAPLVTLLRRAREPPLGQAADGHQGRRPGGLAPCRLNRSDSTSPACAASCSTSTARSCTATRTGGRGRNLARSTSSSAFARLGRPLVLFTNGSHIGAEAIARGLRDDGLPINDDELLTPVESAITYLRRLPPRRAGAAVLLGCDPRADRGFGRADRGRPRPSGGGVRRACRRGAARRDRVRGARGRRTARRC